MLKDVWVQFSETFLLQLRIFQFSGTNSQNHILNGVRIYNDCKSFNIIVEKEKNLQTL